MLSRTLCYTLQGIEGAPVTVECYAGGGNQFQFVIVGLPDTAVKESRDRVQAALKNSGFIMPYGHTTVNLSPADLKKEGSVFDLPIAVSIIAATQQVKMYAMEHILLLGELGLDGRLIPVKGVLPLVISARANGVGQVILPRDNAPEVASVSGIEVYPAGCLFDVVAHLSGKNLIEKQRRRSYEDCLKNAEISLDLQMIRGQHAAKRALEIAAAGAHNLMMIGTPGSGKTMLARSLPGILPLMTEAESFETTRIYSSAGLLPTGMGLMTQRPFRTPHHTASAASLIGGGADARPGEVSLAHNGVLFLDEMPEYPRKVLDALRQPLEDGFATVSRVKARARYQSRCMLVASMNPCPCGYYGSKARQCRCGSHEIRKYLDRISGPLLDRIDIQVEVDAVPIEDIIAKKDEESSLDVRQRVERARNIQKKRFEHTNIRANAQMDNKALEKFARADDSALDFLKKAMDRYGMSMRAYTRMLKVARTIADLSERENITLSDVAEAVQLRTIDKKYWGTGHDA
jgi:magnesium chelatase family protein